MHVDGPVSVLGGPGRRLELPRAAQRLSRERGCSSSPQPKAAGGGQQTHPSGRGSNTDKEKSNQILLLH